MATSIAHLHAYICMCMKKRLFCKKQFHHDQLNQPFFGPAEVGVEAFELEAEEPSLALSAPSISFKSLSLVSCCICFSYSLTSLTAKQSKWIKKTFNFFLQICHSITSLFICFYNNWEDVCQQRLSNWNSYCFTRNGIPQNVTHAYDKNEICPKFLEAANQPTQRWLICQSHLYVYVCSLVAKDDSWNQRIKLK